MKSFFYLVIFCFCGFILPYTADAVYDPLSVSNNRIGVHILDPAEIFSAAKLVNSSGGQWGYVTIPLRSDDRDRIKWLNFFKACSDNKVIPIIRLATYVDNDYWTKPNIYDLVDHANFLNDMPWPVKNRYIVLYNEPNHAKEWGNSISPSEYSRLLIEAKDIFKSRSEDFFLISAGLDMSAPHNQTSSDALKFIQSVTKSFPGWYQAVDGLSFHAYPNPGFSSSVNSKSRYGITSYRFETSLLKRLGYSTKPIFITETGYLGTGNFYKPALENIWIEKNIVAITPFVLFAGIGDFARFSLLDTSNNPKPGYTEIFNIQKLSGAPLLNEQSSPKSEIVESFQSATVSAVNKPNIFQKIINFFIHPAPTLTIGNITINVELAQTSQQITRGLSGRKYLPDDTGMLFIFPFSQFQTFWMKDMKFPLDLIWVDRDRVVEITTNAPNPTNSTDRPFTVTSSHPVNKVLEVNAGFVSKYSIRVGDRVVLNSR